jgi:hypothetical protein
MSRFNVNSNHPITPNSQEYMTVKKYVSIHSEDRDITKYPSSSVFDVELPQDYLNVVKIRLESWAFPSNYYSFSKENFNILLSFYITEIYDPYLIINNLEFAIQSALLAHQHDPYITFIEEGFYNPPQMAQELTNKMNYVVSVYISSYLETYNSTLSAEDAYLSLTQDDIDYFNSYKNTGHGGYEEFVVVYNIVGQKIWFGNRSSGFSISPFSTTIQGLFNNTEFTDIICQQHLVYPEYLNGNSVREENSNQGLCFNLGFLKDPINSSSLPVGDSYRFYYGDTPLSGGLSDNGFWLRPDPNKPESKVYYIVPPCQINFMGPSFIYMELDGLNHIDELNPYALTNFTKTTNETNSRVNSAFAKIGVVSAPITEFYDNSYVPYKFYNPPAERIRKLKIRIRYHNNRLVNFGTFSYSFMLEFTLLTPQKLTNMSTTQI